MMIKNNTILIWLIFLLFGCNESVKKTETLIKTKSEEQEYIYKNLDGAKRILKDIYQSKDFDSLDNIIWYAPKIDFPEIPICYDKKYHTSIDTTIYFIDNNDDSCAIIILANYNIQIENGKETQAGGHFDPVSLGVALFIKGHKGWELYKIKKHLTELGYGGTYRTGRNDAGKISLKKFGKKWTCLSFRQGVGGNTGEFWGYERFFSIEKELPKGLISNKQIDEMSINNYEILNQIFSYNYHHNYYYPDLENQNSIDISLRTMPSSNEIYKLQIVVDETNYHVETNKINSRKKSIREYYFSPSLYVFIENNTPNSK